MSNYVVAISIDKVQDFLYYVINAHVQEKQTNSGTLKSIIKSSKIISNQLYKDIGTKENCGEFKSDQIEEELLKCSGMYIFTTSIEEDLLKERLNSLFEKYYMKFNGRLFMKYIYFEMDIKSDSDKIKSIKKSKKRLRGKECLNDIIAQNKDILFRFRNSVKLDSIVENEDNKYPMFVPDIDKLYKEGNKGSVNHFRIAVIKADLDGMGNLLSQIEEYTAYDAISKILSKEICLDALSECVEEFQRKNSEFLIYPLYVAGDDIFFAVDVSQLITGIEVCRVILLRINEKISKKLAESNQTNYKPISMSIGVEFTFNREPIRYYHERVEKQLGIAKGEAWKGKESAIKISINQYVFYIYNKSDIAEMETNIPNWHHFIHGIKLLKNIIENNFKVHHFLNELLTKITEPVIRSNKIKYSNAVLYHLLPQYIDSPNKKLRESELVLIEMLMKQLLVKKGKSSALVFDPNECKGFETYIRLLLLFSDPRFKVTETVNYNVEVDATMVKRLRSRLFNKPLKYLYDENLLNQLMPREKKRDIQDLRNIFIDKTRYKADEKSKNMVEIYRVLNVSKSMFHRMKKIESERVQKAGAMMQSADNRPEKEIKELEKTCKAENKTPPKLYFNKNAFCKSPVVLGLWTQDYIDSLSIFYQYNELSIRYKKLYPSKRINKGSKKNIGKNGK